MRSDLKQKIPPPIKPIIIPLVKAVVADAIALETLMPKEGGGPGRQKGHRKEGYGPAGVDSTL
jgi:hypothetical protein